jgi:hypothetical protein
MTACLEMMTAGFRRGYPAISLLLLWSAPEKRLAVPEFADVGKFNVAGAKLQSEKLKYLRGVHPWQQFESLLDGFFDRQKPT